MRCTVFVTCLGDTFYPPAVKAMIRVLEKIGMSCSYPENQTCCGQPMNNAGYFDQARGVAKKFIETFEGCEGPIICPSASCTAMVRCDYLTLFENDPDWLIRARDLGNRIFEFSEFLVQQKKIDLRALGASLDESLTYHYSCHLRKLNITDEPIQLIKQIENVDYRPLQNIDQCCGFGGTFSVNLPHLSEALVKRKTQTILDTKADCLIYSDAGCAMNITGYANRIGKPIKAMHLSQLIAKSLGIDDE